MILWLLILWKSTLFLVSSKDAKVAIVYTSADRSSSRLNSGKFGTLPTSAP